MQAARLLYALTRADEIRDAFDYLTQRLMDGSVPCGLRTVSYPNGHVVVLVYWRPDEGFWFHLSVQSTHYHCWYGVGDPGEKNSRNLSLTCEVNPPIEGSGTGCRGTFARDRATGAVYYLHTGTFSDKRVNELANQYFKLHPELRRDVRWPTGRTRKRIIISALNDVALIKNIAWYVQLTEGLKERAKES